MERGDRILWTTMKSTVNAAWREGWEEAIHGYRCALNQHPDDIDLLTGLGIAYSKSDRPEKALRAYRKASELAPEDPALLERIGAALEKLGRDEEAAQAYLFCGNRIMDREQDPRLAARCWEAAVRLHPRSVAARTELLRHYQSVGKIDQAVDQCLVLASIYAESGRADLAVRICRHALGISPHQDEVLAVLDELDRATEEPELREPDSQPGQELSPPADLPGFAPPEFGPLQADVSPRFRGSPLDSTAHRALRELAGSIFDDPSTTSTTGDTSRSEVLNLLIARAVDLQTRGRIGAAIGSYEEAITKGAAGPAVHFNLGLLYEDVGLVDEALDAFTCAASDSSYALGSHLAMAECCQRWDRVSDALEHLTSALRIVDLPTVDAEHAGDLADLYAHHAHRYLDEDEDVVVAYADSLAAFFRQSGWEERVERARRQLGALSRERPVVSLAEVIAVPYAERILESIATSQNYVARGLPYTAVETCHFALDFGPDHLALHRQLGEISAKMGRIDQAVSTFVVVADSYAARGAKRHAAGMYERALQLSPMDTDVRARLIEQLVRDGELDGALRHYLLLADSYSRLAQMERAREIYDDALRLASRDEIGVSWTVRILHRIGDIDLQRIEWERAVSVYERIRSLEPDDERARLALVDLYYRLGRRQQAIQELDELLQIYYTRDRIDDLLAVLGDSVEKWPDRISIRARLAEAYLRAGQTDAALAHLEQLGDLQLAAGRDTEAEATIRAIVALNPPGVDAFKSVLRQIEGGQVVGSRS